MKNVFSKEEVAKSFNKRTQMIFNKMTANINYKELTAEMKAVLDKRLQEDEKTYLTAEESMNKLLSILHKK